MKLTLPLTTFLAALTTAMPTSTPNIHMSIAAASSSPTKNTTAHTLSCTENNRKCESNAVFMCRAGAWEAIAACRSYERCVGSPSPHCTWA
jgi:hypothetical protein